MAKVMTVEVTRSGFSQEITNVQWGDYSATEINASHFGSTTFEEYIYKTLIEAGRVTFDCHLDGAPPTPGVSAATSLAFKSGGSTIFTVAGNATIVSAEPTVPLQDKATLSIVMKWDDAITVT